MKRTTQIIIIFLIFLISSITANAVARENDYSFVVDGIYYKVISDNTCRVTYKEIDKYGNPNSTYTGEIEIPSKVTYSNYTYTVVEIGGGAFAGSGITSVKLPNSINKICDAAFARCNNLTNFSIPNSVKQIDIQAFSECKNISSLVIPNSVTEMGTSVFQGCYGLTEVELSNSCTTIEDGVFSFCTSLKSIKIPECVTTIKSGAFSWCTSLESLKLPNSITSISGYAFQGCTGLTSPIYNNSLFVKAPPTYSGEYIMPEGLTTICEGAFYDCDDITSVRISDGITNIEKSAFQSTKIESVYIPSSVKTIGQMAFAYCHKLTSVTVKNDSPDKITIGSSLFYDNCGYYHKRTLYVPKGSVEKYSNEEQWRALGEIVEIPPILVSSISFGNGDIELQRGETYKIAVSITPDNADDKSLAWTSSNTSVATVDSEGNVKAVGKGSTIITAKANDESGVSASCIVTVTLPDCATPTFSQNGDKLTISCATDGAMIYYSIGGTEPTNASTKYSSPISITDNRTIKAIAYKEGYNTSAVAIYTPNPIACQNVVISVNGTTATMTCATNGATIHYTLDGTNPTSSSTVYTSPVELTRNCTIKAVAMKENMNDSEVATYEVNSFTVATPSFSQEGDRLTISCATNDAMIYYTIGGAEPTNASTKYTGPISITDNKTIKAIAYKDGYNTSAVASYSPNSVTCSEVSISVNGTTATLTCATSGATIHYTLDGSTPAASSSVYTSPITLTRNCTIKAVAMKENMNDSPIASYTVSTFTASTPTFSLNGDKLAIMCATNGATIYYTIGGSEPTNASTKYTGPITISDNKIIKAIAYAYGFNPSTVASFTPNSVACQQVAISVSGTTATMTCATSGATIYYTLDGTSPTASSSVYSSPITLTHNCTIKAVAMKENMNDSEVASYSVSSFGCSDVTMSYDGRMVSLSSGTDGAVIHYTTDGSTPTAASGGYTKPFDAGGIVTVKAIATKENWNDSEVMVEKLSCYSDGRVAWIDEAGAVDKAMGVCGTDSLAAVVWNVNGVLADEALKGVDNHNLLLYVKMRGYAPSSVTNVVVNNQAEKIELVDGGNFFVPKAFTAKRISYTHRYSMTTPRDGSVAGWETIALPFDVQGIAHESHGAAAPFAANVSGAKPFWLYSLGESGWQRAAVIKANTPYIICMPNNDDYADDYILAGEVTFSAENVAVPVTEPKAARNGETMFVPTTMSVAKGDAVFAINKNEQNSNRQPGSMFIPSLRNVSPFEAYITVANAARAPKAIGIFDIGDDNDMATDILAIPTNTSNDGNVYTLTGVLVRTDGQTRGLAKGVYIVDEKKVMVK